MAVCKILNVAAAMEQELHERLSFEVTLDVAENLAEDVLIRCCFILDPRCPDKDVELDSMEIGNDPGVNKGVMKFILDAPAPTQMLLEEAGGPLEVQGMYLAAVYRGSEFCRIGYYLRHEYVDKDLQESPPETVDWSKLRRVLSDPTHTRFDHAWDDVAKPAGEDAAANGGHGAADGEVEVVGEPPAKMLRVA
eukprot:TRINITY_DN21592_c0_g1_i1.p1 TRINITY_DN21592_c0_g1~~TRINITY_DN21592_c0_g1_i1.p1  ORF type:complete len:193 (-),score=56.07 TRINITY_DN21592_c0_g1_i1:219-797(-)